MHRLDLRIVVEPRPHANWHPRHHRRPVFLVRLAQAPCRAGGSAPAGRPAGTAAARRSAPCPRPARAPAGPAARAIPCPVSAEIGTLFGSPASARSISSAPGSWSILFSAVTIGWSVASSSPSTSSTVATCSSTFSCVMSTTCTITSASAISSSVARKAATSAVGSFWMKPDGVGEQHFPAPRQLHAPRGRVERGEQLVGRIDVGAAERVQQRRLAGVGVADQRHDRESLPQCAGGGTAPGASAPLPARASGARCAGRSRGGRLPAGSRRGRAAPRPRCRRGRPRRPSGGPGASTPVSAVGRRYSSWASSTWSAPSRVCACCAKISRISAVRSSTLTLSLLDRLLELALLAGRKLLVEDDHVRARVGPQRDQLLDLARADQRRRVRPVEPLLERADDLQPGRVGQPRQLGQRILHGPGGRLPLNSMPTSRAVSCGAWVSCNWFLIEFLPATASASASRSTAAMNRLVVWPSEIRR